MNCLCCGKPLKDNGQNGWHKSCIKRFFNTQDFPEININNDSLEELVNKTTKAGFTVPGVQKKLSLHLFSETKKPRLTLVNYPAGYILKPQVDEYRALPESEQLVMNMADTAGIVTVPHALIENDGKYAYITKRVDRKTEKDRVKMLAMEDFCQLDMRLTIDKYKGSYERCSKIISKYSNRENLDMSELFLRIVFSYVVGNSDMHLKNFSLIETDESSGIYILSPAYDLLPVNIILPTDKEQFALTLNGKKMNIRKKDFLVFADSCGITRNSALKMIASIVSCKDKFIKMCEESLLPEDMKENLISLITNRITALQ